MSVSKKISTALYNFIEKRQEIMEPENVKYGLDYFCASVLKILIVLIISYLLGFFLETIVCMLSFGLLRQYCGGAHMPNSFCCLFSMIFIYSTIIAISYFILIPSVVLIVIAVFSFECVRRYAPADTRKHPITGPKHRKKLKIKSIIVYAIGIATAFWFKENIAELILLSFLIQSITLLPIAYRITLTERRINSC